MEKVTIARLGWRKENKEGKLYMTKMGKPFEMCNILIKETQKWASSPIFDRDHDAYGWKEGDKVELVLEQNGQYLNFKVPTRLDKLELRLEAIEKKLGVTSSAVAAESVFNAPPEPILPF